MSPENYVTSEQNTNQAPVEPETNLVPDLASDKFFRQTYLRTYRSN
jgi:hypothetical protein